MRFLHLGEQEPVRTNIDIDDALIREAMRRCGAPTKKACRGRPPFARSDLLPECIRKLRGKVRWDGNLNQSRLGRIREIVVRRHMVIVDATVWIDYLGGTTNPCTSWLNRELTRQRRD